MRLTKRRSTFKEMLKDWRKNRALRKYQAAIQRRHYSELCYIINLDHLDSHFGSEHIEELLRITDKLRVLIIARYETTASQFTEVIEPEKVQVRYIPQHLYGFETKMLIGDNEVFVSDGEIHSVIKNPRFAADMQGVFDERWIDADKIPTSWVTVQWA